MLLVFTNTRPVWRLNTRGDYWVLDRAAHKLRKLGGADAKRSTLMFAKFSPDGRRVGYVRRTISMSKILDSGAITPLTSDGSRTLINGTFDWVYEEELMNYYADGWRWSPDGKNVSSSTCRASTGRTRCWGPGSSMVVPPASASRESTGLITDTNAQFVPHYIAAPRSSARQVAGWLAEDDAGMPAGPRDTGPQNSRGAGGTTTPRDAPGPHRPPAFRDLPPPHPDPSTQGPQ